MPKTYEGWCRGLIVKYPAETLAVLAKLCEAGLRNGNASANDLVGMDYPKPQVVGAAFKVLKRLGFAKSNEITASQRPKSHASFVLVWALQETWKAEYFLNECRSVLLGQEQREESGQALLRM